MTKLIIEIESTADVLDTIDHVRDLIDRGFTSGYYPTWSLE